MANIFNPDEVRTFLIANGYPSQYNDGLREYLRVFYSSPAASLPDLYVRYIVEFGTDLEVSVSAGDKLALELADFFVQEDGTSFILLE